MGWIDAKYSARTFEKLLENYFGDTELKYTISNVLVSAYEIELDDNFFFNTLAAKIDNKKNYKLRDIARAITAAPTYFRPARIPSMAKSYQYTFIDGGVSVNNPTIAATVHAVELYGRNKDFLIISLGIGTNYGANNRKIPHEDLKSAGFLGWANKIISLMTHSVNDITDYQMSSLFIATMVICIRIIFVYRSLLSQKTV